MNFFRLHSQILLAHLGVSIFTGGMIWWSQGFNKGVLFGILYFAFMLLVHFFIYHKHKSKYGKNEFK